MWIGTIPLMKRKKGASKSKRRTTAQTRGEGSNSRAAGAGIGRAYLAAEGGDTGLRCGALAPEGDARSIRPIKPCLGSPASPLGPQGEPVPRRQLQGGPPATCAAMIAPQPERGVPEGQRRHEPGRARSRCRARGSAAEGPRLGPRARANTDTHTRPALQRFISKSQEQIPRLVWTGSTISRQKKKKKIQQP